MTYTIRYIIQIEYQRKTSTKKRKDHVTCLFTVYNKLVCCFLISFLVPEIVFGQVEAKLPH